LRNTEQLIQNSIGAVFCISLNYRRKSVRQVYKLIYNLNTIQVNDLEYYYTILRDSYIHLMIIQNVSFT